jgi:hypothetical protein
MPTIRVRSLGEFQRVLKRDLKAIEGKFQKAVRKAATRGARAVRKEAPEATGGLRQSIFAQHTDKTSTIAVASPIAEVILKGSRPHMPPVGAILKWVEAKGLASGKDAESMAWAIALDIAEYGTQPNPFIQRALPRLNEIMRDELDKVIREN